MCYNIGMKIGLKRRAPCKMSDMAGMKSTKAKVKPYVFLMAAVGACALQAVGVTVSQLPVSPFADTEVFRV